MARLTYAALALALAALISGFFVRTSAAPLFASIGLSALVLVLILRGWARRVRTVRGSGEDALDAEPIEVVDMRASELDLDEAEDAGEPRVGVRSRARSRQAAKPKPRVRPKPAAGGRPRPRPAPVAARRSSAESTGRVVVLPGRTRYHVPGCRFATGKGAQQISEAAARRRRYEPCSVCLG